MKRYKNTKLPIMPVGEEFESNDVIYYYHTESFRPNIYQFPRIDMDSLEETGFVEQVEEIKPANQLALKSESDVEFDEISLNGIIYVRKDK